MCTCARDRCIVGFVRLVYSVKPSFLTIRFHSAVYLYGEAATEDHRKTVPQIRLGEYEGLPEKVRNFFTFWITVRLNISKWWLPKFCFFCILMIYKCRRNKIQLRDWQTDSFTWPGHRELGDVKSWLFEHECLFPIPCFFFFFFFQK